MSEASDPRGLIREAYAIEGIGAGECRSIFLDWALFDTAPEDQPRHAATLLALYASQAPDHPMTRLLEQVSASPATPRRRGGRGRREN